MNVTGTATRLTVPHIDGRYCTAHRRKPGNTVETVTPPTVLTQQSLRTMTRSPAVPAGSGHWRPGRNAGFTLVELMMAVTVLGVLAALGSVSYASYRDRVDMARALHDLGALSNTIDMFVLDNRRLPDDLEEAGLAGRLDPWGRAYVYLPLRTPADRGRARKDRRLVPINSDYDLYSKGKDGESRAPLTARHSHDDVIRAGSGSFFGKAEDF